MPYLTYDDKATFKENGYLVKHDLLTEEQLQNALDVIWEHLECDRDDPGTWIDSGPRNPPVGDHPAIQATLYESPIFDMAEEIVVMYHGKVMESGTLDDIFRHAEHPYLNALLRAVPRFDMKPGERLVADANTGWVQHEAARVVSAVQDVDVYIEQPCLSYEECLAIRRRISHPFVLDESIDGMDVLMRGHADGAMDVVNIKISKFGGLTPARQARDLCVKLGIGMTIEDSWGGDITTAAIAHLAHSTPTELLFTATDFNSYVTVSTAEGAPQRNGGRLAASTEPGLGVVPRADVLGEPVLTIA